MKKFCMFLAVFGLVALTATYAFGQEMSAQDLLNGQSDVPVYQQLKEKFIEGGAGFMASVLICLILGLAVAIERIIYLTLSTTNTQKLLAKVEDALKNGGVEAAKEVCRNTRGPVASIFYQGLSRMDEGMEVVEKSVDKYKEAFELITGKKFE